MDEQEEIIEKVKEIQREHKGQGFSWNRFRGDAITRVVAHYLGNHLPKRVKIVRLAWVEGCPTEFDLLIVDKDAEPVGFTGTYPKDKVHLLIEVKAAGVFYRKSEVKKKMKELFKSWRETTDNKPVLYLTIWERSSYRGLIVEALGEDVDFTLRDENGVRRGEWERFVQRVKL